MSGEDWSEEKGRKESQSMSTRSLASDPASLQVQWRE